MEFGAGILEKAGSTQANPMGFVFANLHFCSCRTMRSAIKNRRLQRRDWVVFGLKLLASGGPRALRLEKLCQKAGKTRGSFYHHFVDHDAFTREMIDLWIEKNTLNIIELVNQTDSQSKRSKLFDLTSSMDHQLDAAIRKLATSNSAAEKAVKKVDRLRTDYLKQIFTHELEISAARAGTLAEIHYATFLGMQLLNPGAKKRQAMGKMIDEQLRSLTA